MATTSPKDEGSSRSNTGAIGLLFGRLLCLSGLFTAILGVPTEDISLEAMGVFLGILGYILGARVLGVATSLISAVLMFVVMMMFAGELSALRL